VKLCVAPTHHLGTRCAWSASSPGRALLPGKDLRYPLDRRPYAGVVYQNKQRQIHSTSSPVSTFINFHTFDAVEPG
jgi:hypothetical protein